LAGEIKEPQGSPGWLAFALLPTPRRRKGDIQESRKNRLTHVELLANARNIFRPDTFDAGRKNEFGRAHRKLLLSFEMVGVTS